MEETALYAVFLHQALVRFAERISRVISGRGERTTVVTAPLRTDFAKFQARDYFIELSRSVPVQRVFEGVRGALGVEPFYAEVQAELDRLADLESALAEGRLRREAAIVEASLAFVAVMGILQTLVAWWDWSDKIAGAAWSHSPAVLWSTLAGAGGLAGFLLLRHRRSGSARWASRDPR